jgi:hypothetical protein
MLAHVCQAATVGAYYMHAACMPAEQPTATLEHRSLRLKAHATTVCIVHMDNSCMAGDVTGLSSRC